MDRHARGQRGDLGDERRRIVDEIRLVEDDDRRGAAFPRGHQIALDAARIEIVIEAGHQEDDVDVGGDDLLLGGIAGGAAREARRARQDGADPRVAASPGAASTATQSPTAGKSARPAASCRSRPDTRARLSPSGAITR